MRGLKHQPLPALHWLHVAPHAGAWIETLCHQRRQSQDQVAPHAGAWIETYRSFTRISLTNVAPHAGAWIETVKIKCGIETEFVAPHAGAWIETVILGRFKQTTQKFHRNFKNAIADKA